MREELQLERSGAKRADSRVAPSRKPQVDYITILMGGNDVCASSESAMTPVDTSDRSPDRDNDLRPRRTRRATW